MNKLNSLLGFFLLISTLVSSPVCAQEAGHTLFDDSTRYYTSLEYLSYGLIYANQQTVDNELARIVFENAAYGLDHYFWVSYDTLIQRCLDEKIDLIALMNEGIIEEYKLDETVDYVSSILKTNRFGEKNFTYHVLVPYLDSLVDKPLNDLHYLELTSGDLDDLTNVRPLTGFITTERTYPISGFEISGSDIVEASITKSEAKAGPLIISCGEIPIEDFIDGSDQWLVYLACAATTPLCDACLNPIPPEEIWQEGSGSGLFNYEVELRLKDAIDPTGFGCYTSMTPLVQGQSASRYARLSKITEIDYYEGGSSGLVRVNHPIIKPGINPTRYDEVTLCEEVNKICDAIGFNAVCEDYYALDYGIYKIQKLNLQPFYFVYTYAEQFWFVYGQDVRIQYGNQTLSGDLQVDCSDLQEIIEDYEEQGCLMCSTNEFAYPRKYISSSDLDFLLEYWNDEVFTVGITPENSWNVFDCSFYEFHADNDPSFNSSCSNITAGEPSTLGSQILQISSSSSFLPLRDNLPSVYQTTDKIAIHVEAEYPGANDIDSWATIELDASQPAWQRITMYFRGKIQNYTVTFYEVP